MLVPSEWISHDTETDKCYLGIFPNDNAKEMDAFYLGSMYFQKYYTFFDLNGEQTGAE